MVAVKSSIRERTRAKKAASTSPVQGANAGGAEPLVYPTGSIQPTQHMSGKNYPSNALSRALGLKHKADLRSMGIVLFTLALLAYRWNTYRRDEHLLKYCAYTVLSCLFCWYSATVVHNSIHFPIFHGGLAEGANPYWHLFLSAAYGYPVSTLVPGHNLSHHKYTQGEKDCIRTTQMKWSYNLINLATFVLTIGPAIMEQDASYFASIREKGLPLWNQVIFEAAWLILHQGFLMWLNLHTWWWVICIPQLFGKFGIISINLMQHDGCTTPEEDIYNFSRNFVDWKLNWFTCNNGYHTIHHLMPTTHWSEYPRLHHEKLVASGKMHPGCDVDSLCWFIIKTFFLPGGRLTYDGKPYHPGTELFDRQDVPSKPWFTEEFFNEFNLKRIN